MRKIPSRFEVFFDNDSFKPANDPELTIGKVRMFYKYSNRNGSYFTDEFSELFATTAYAKPIFGAYVKEDKDFSTHVDSSLSKAYGFIVPDSLEWQDHLDNDGVIRNYATYDAVIWSKYWKEARDILGKGQSMEVDPDTIVGEWKYVSENSTTEEFVYTKGVVAGLCILGDTVEPCFEGAAFFSKNENDYAKFVAAVERYLSINGGKNKMIFNVKGVENASFTKLVGCLNPLFNEENSYTLESIPCAFEDNTFKAIDITNPEGVVNIYQYTIDENNDNEITCTLQSTINYSSIISNKDSKITNISNELEELNTKYTQVTQERDELNTKFEQLSTQFAALQEDFNANKEALESQQALMNDQKRVIDEYVNIQKQAVIDRFTNALLPAEVIQSIVDNKDNYTLEELNNALSVAFANYALSDKKGSIRFPQAKKTDPQQEKLFTILSAYKK